MSINRAAVESAIHSLAACYANFADMRNGKGFASLFTEGGVLQFPGAEIEGLDAIEQFIGNIPAAFPKSWHHTSSHCIEVLSDRKARGTAYYVCYSEKEADHWGVYEDEYTEVNGEWFFQKEYVM